MNIRECDVLTTIADKKPKNQRLISELSGHSLGIVNRSVRSLIEKGYLNKNLQITEKGQQKLESNRPECAIILAAGFGMRMVPINMETPKGLLEVHGEPLIERLICQLQEVGIHKIYIVVGFMKEHFEYLMDKYNVELIANSEYDKKNNLHSLIKVIEHLSNAYIVPCDIWCLENPFKRSELYSWYMVSDQEDTESWVRVNKKMELVFSGKNETGHKMIGISYLQAPQASRVQKRLIELSGEPYYDHAFWEAALYNDNKMIVAAKVVQDSYVLEINTYEQLRELDQNSNHLKTDAITLISNVLSVEPEMINNISILKKGMTNRSFVFSCKEKRYIMRIPGEGTEALINRRQEAEVYRVIKDRELSDRVVYINPDNGYKISEYLTGARVCDCNSRSDVEKCMAQLRQFHRMELKVDHEFDIFRQIDFYEGLWDGAGSAYKDYDETKHNVFSLRDYIKRHTGQKTLTHIDSVPDNFLFVPDGCGHENIRLIDWEYSGMQDPHVDIAMFCIYAMYSRKQIDELIDIYFENCCSPEIRLKIYCYISACGLLWSNWCEYKRMLGVDFGEYSLRQYRYAKEYFRIVQKEILN